MPNVLVTLNNSCSETAQETSNCTEQWVFAVLFAPEGKRCILRSVICGGKAKMDGFGMNPRNHLLEANSAPNKQ